MDRAQNTLLLLSKAPLVCVAFPLVCPSLGDLQMRIVSKQLFQTASCGIFLHELISRKPLTFLASMAPSSKGCPILVPCSPEISHSPDSPSSRVWDRPSALSWHHTRLQLILMVTQTTNNLPRISGTWLNSKMRQPERDPDLLRRWICCPMCHGCFGSCLWIAGTYWL